MHRRHNCENLLLPRETKNQRPLHNQSSLPHSFFLSTYFAGSGGGGGGGGDDGGGGSDGGDGGERLLHTHMCSRGGVEEMREKVAEFSFGWGCFGNKDDDGVGDDSGNELDRLQVQGRQFSIYFFVVVSFFSVAKQLVVVYLWRQFF